MCTCPIPVKAVSKYSPSLSFVPCGHCEECRDSKKYQWQFRLRVELDWCRKQKWNIGFFTLTYDSEHLPTIPDALFATEADVPDSPIPCFSRAHVRTFIDNIRKRLYDIYRTTSLRYMICSEYGSSKNTRRPHYHGIISFPPDCDPKKVFALVHSQWKNGHVFPRYFEGGRDSHGYNHKPFLIQGDTQGAAIYGAKYVCKDIGFYKTLAGLQLVEKDDPSYSYLRDCMPFHIQSRSIGKSYLSNLSTSDILKVLRDGESFVGVSKRVHLPLYIRNKILYNPKYSFVERVQPSQPVADWWYDFEADKWCYKKGCGTHYRQVTKEPTKFLLENYDLIYQQKKEYYIQFFKDISLPSYWINRGASRSAAVSVVSHLSKISDLSHFVDYFICYYGVKRDYWYSAVPSRQWLLRYTSDLPKSRPVGKFFVFSDERVYDGIINSVLTRMENLTSTDKVKRARIAETQDLYKHSA